MVAADTTTTQLTELETGKSKLATPGPNPQPLAPSPDSRLMQRIKTQWGAHIQEACKYSSVPQEFLAALIANESGGDPQAKRFEKAVYNKLLRIHQGAPEHYGPLTAETLRAAADEALRDWATSWGLTQVMGYHVARRPGGIKILLNPKSHLNFALGLLAEFAERFGLRVTLEFEEMFRCWNTGGPYKETYDPKYCERGLARMKIYHALAREESGVRSQEPGAKS